MTQREAAGADLACAGADGFVDDDAQTGLTGHLVDEHGDMPYGLGQERRAVMTSQASAVAWE